MALREMLARRRIERELEKLSQDAAKKAPNADEDSGSPTPRHFQFIIVNLQEASPEVVNGLLSGVIDCLFRHNATLCFSSPTLVSGYFGVPVPEHDLPEERTAAVAELLRENGSSIRLLHGECTAPVGNFGTSPRWIYDAMLPGYTAKLKTLFDLEFGSALELKD